MDSERLLPAARDDWKRSLLQAAASEVAPECVQAQVLGALAALGDTAASAGTPTLGPKLTALEGIGATKLALLLLLAVGAPSAYWLASRDTDSARVTASEQVPAAIPAAASTLLPAPLPPADALVAPLEQAPPRPLPPSTSKSRPRPKPLAPVTADPLSAELRLLSVARSQLRAGSAPAALETLAGYRRTFPRGVLAPEAEQLELRARELALQGR